MNENKWIVVVPDGLEFDAFSDCCVKPSFVFRAVLDYVSHHHKFDEIWIAPANNFGFPISEEVVGLEYLKAYGCRNVRVPEINKTSLGYIDTLGNAYYLKKFLNAISKWPPKEIELVVGKTHARRAELCFKSQGFDVEIRSISYEVDRNSRIVGRLFYYKYPSIHYLYEKIAYLRDFLRIKFFYRS